MAGQYSLSRRRRRLARRFRRLIGSEPGRVGGRRPDFEITPEIYRRLQEPQPGVGQRPVTPSGHESGVPPIPGAPADMSEGGQGR